MNKALVRVICAHGVRVDGSTFYCEAMRDRVGELVALESMEPESFDDMRVRFRDGSHAVATLLDFAPHQASAPAARHPGPAGLWDALLRQPAPRAESADPQPASEVQAGTKVARLIAELAECETATTASLATCVGITTNQVWGLLKAARKNGQVRFAGTRWELVRTYAGRDVDRAAELLRRNGWRVEPPTRHAV